MSDAWLDFLVDIFLDLGPVFGLIWWAFWDQWTEIAWLNVWYDSALWDAVEVADNCECQIVILDELERLTVVNGRVSRFLELFVVHDAGQIRGVVNSWAGVYTG